MNRTLLLTFIGAGIGRPCGRTTGPRAGQVADEYGLLRERFVSPPPGSGTVTLYWLNGKITKEGIREQMRAMRDQCGFGGVAPLTFHSDAAADASPPIFQMNTSTFTAAFSTPPRNWE